MLQVVLIRSWCTRKRDKLRFPPKKFKGSKYTKPRFVEHGKTDTCRELAYYVQDTSGEFMLRDLLLMKRLTRFPELRGDPEPVAVLSCKYFPPVEGMPMSEEQNKPKYQYHIKMNLGEKEVLDQTIVTNKAWGFLSDPQFLLKGVDTYGFEALHLIPVVEGDGEDEPDRVHQGFKDAVMVAYKADFTLRLEGKKVYFADSEGAGLQHNYLNHFTEEWQFVLETLCNNWADPENKDPHKMALTQVCSQASYCIKFLAPYESTQIVKPRQERRAISYFSWLYEEMILPLDLPEELTKSEPTNKVIAFLAKPQVIDSPQTSALLSKEVPAFFERICNVDLHPEYDENMRVFTNKLKEHVQFLTENSDLQAFNYLQKGMVWRTKYWNLDIFRVMVQDFVSSLSPRYKIMHPWTGQVKWQGTQPPLHLLEVFGHVVVIHSHHLVYTPAAESLDPDESTWKRVDLHTVASNRIRVIGNSSRTQAYRQEGCIFLQTPENILKVDLNPLNHDQPPVCSVLVEVPADLKGQRTAAMSNNYCVSALEAGKFLISSLSAIEKTSSVVTIEEFADSGFYRPERLYIFRRALLVVWYPDQPILVSFEIRRTSEGVGLELTSQVRVESGWSYRYTHAPPVVAECWGKIPLLVAHSGCRDGLHLSVFAVHNQKLQRVGQKQVLQTPPHRQDFPRHQRDLGQYFCDPKTRRVCFYSTTGQYGEGYTISVHPLKLLLN